MEQFKRLMARGLLTLSALCLLSAPVFALFKERNKDFFTFE